MQSKTYLMLLGFSIFTGATFSLAKYTVDFFSAASAAGWRFGIAALLMFSILAIQKKVNIETLRFYGGIYTILGIIGVFGFNVFFFLGMKYTSPLNGALIMGTNPLLTTILAYFILKTPVTRKQMTGIIVALTGVVLVLIQGSLEVIYTLSISVGDLFILLGNLCWALYGVLGKKYLKQSSSIETTTYTMIVGALCLIILALFLPSPQPISKVTLPAWGAILFMAIFTSVLGYLWWNKAIEKIGAANASIFFNLVPVVTMIISFITGSKILYSQVLGTFLVFFGVLISSGYLISLKRFKSASKI